MIQYKTMNGHKYRLCHSSKGEKTCDHCGREIPPQDMVCHSNYVSNPIVNSPARSEGERNHLIETYCESCKYFDGRASYQQSRCKQAGCQQVTLWQRISAVDWQCPKKYWSTARKNNRLRWISSRTLARDAIRLIEKLPSDIDSIIAVPRSGFLPASIIATTLHLPLYTINGNSGLIACGSNGRLLSKSNQHTIKHALVIDDTTCRGHAMKTVHRWMKQHTNFQYSTAAVYISANFEHFVDFYLKAVKDPHLLEWNLFNNKMISNMACDMDGILCPDVPRHLDDDGEKYTKCLQTMPVKYAARRSEIGTIITARLEKYRNVTKRWLAENGILYKDLIMGPWRNNAERTNQVAAWKSDIYKQTNHQLMIESDDCLAAKIFKLTNRPVLCPFSEKIYQ